MTAERNSSWNYFDIKTKHLAVNGKKCPIALQGRTTNFKLFGLSELSFCGKMRTERNKQWHLHIHQQPVGEGQDCMFDECYTN